MKRVKILCHLWLRILLCLLSFKPLVIIENYTINETGYYLIIDDINMYLYFDKMTTLDKGLEMHDISKNDGPLIISGHSGSGALALFNDLERLEKNMFIKVVHNNCSQEYEIIDLIIYEKFSNVVIPNDKEYLYLITCDKNDMQKQWIINAKLAKKICL